MFELQHFLHVHWILTNLHWNDPWVVLTVLFGCLSRGVDNGAAGAPTAAPKI